MQCGFHIWQVLYWGLRDLRRVNLFEVEKPQVRMECAGQMIESEEIANYKQNPNFTEIVKHFDVVSLLRKGIKKIICAAHYHYCVTIYVVLLL